MTNLIKKICNISRQARMAFVLLNAPNHSIKLIATELIVDTQLSLSVFCGSRIELYFMKFYKEYLSRE